MTFITHAVALFFIGVYELRQLTDWHAYGPRSAWLPVVSLSFAVRKIKSVANVRRLTAEQ